MSISRFYAGRSLFITGGSGYIGKQVIEKLLRSCPDIDRIYMLIRAKKGLSPQQRLQQTLSSEVFGKLGVVKPHFSQQIIPVTGDIAADGLGISDADRRRLESNVSVVIHLAATLSFAETLSSAVNTKVLGVQRILNLCKAMPNLESLVHVSTAYCHSNKADIDEVIYDAPVSPSDLINMTESLSTAEQETLAHQLLKQHRHQNTYTLAKAAAEKLIDEQRANIPCCVVRPTIVSASYREPVPGWIDNYIGLNGLFTGLGSGVIRSLLTSPDYNTLDIIPVDMTANAVIAAGWYTATKKENQKQVQVYNLTNRGTETMYNAAARISKYIIQSPSSQLPVRRPLTGLGFCTANKALHWYLNWVYVPVRCWIIDRVLVLTGRQPRMMTLCGRSQLQLRVSEFFMSNGFNWSNDNAVKMYSDMSDHDRKAFAFDFAGIDLEEYYCNWWKGIKKYMLKEPEAELSKEPEAELRKTAEREQ